jgi:DNA repair protein RadD
MLLRPRQKTFVDRSVAALEAEGNTLSVAPTGAGKTVMFSAILGRLVGDGDQKALVLAHRDELTAQNRSLFEIMNPKISTSVFDATTKSWDGQVTFSMVPTLSRDDNLATMPHIDLLVIDEAHHAVADTYQKIIKAAKEKNESCRVLGVTATPNRSDRRGLIEVFSNVGDQIWVGELIRSGHLVPPRTHIMDVGINEKLLKLRRDGAEFDMEAAAEVLNQRPINEAVVEHWLDKAKGRPTVVFCSTVDHARDVSQAFEAEGIKTAFVYGDLGSSQRERELAKFQTGEVSVIVNVAVLTEGWDHPPTSCVILLRPSSAKSTMIQMIGRGLRTVDAGKYSGVTKTDCVVLDFGRSCWVHGTIEQDAMLDNPVLDNLDPMQMDCPACGSKIPLASYECPICGEQFEIEKRERGQSEIEQLTHVQMMEVNLLQQSNFLWVDLFGDDSSLISSGFQAWGGLFQFEGAWYAVGGKNGEEAKLLTSGERIVCLAAANDWLNLYETEDTVYKTRNWLSEMPTQKQIKVLPKQDKLDFSLTRYRASALISFEMNKKAIHALITAAHKQAA